MIKDHVVLGKALAKIPSIASSTKREGGRRQRIVETQTQPLTHTLLLFLCDRWQPSGEDPCPFHDFKRMHDVSAVPKNRKLRACARSTSNCCFAAFFLSL
jgi:hypothetical protein